MEPTRLEHKYANSRISPFHRVWRWIKGQIVQDIAHDEAICAFDCRKRECTQHEWETCERRIDQGAGELMPARSKSSPIP